MREPSLEDDLRKLYAEINAPPVSYAFNEPERQLTLLALAELAVSRPGFDHALGEIAEKLRGRADYEDFKTIIDP